VLASVIVAAVVLVANNKEATERRGKALEDAKEGILKRIDLIIME